MPPSLARPVRDARCIRRRCFIYELGLNDYNRIVTVCGTHPAHHIIARRIAAGAKENA